MPFEEAVPERGEAAELLRTLSCWTCWTDWDRACATDDLGDAREGEAGRIWGHALLFPPVIAVLVYEKGGRAPLGRPCEYPSRGHSGV